MALSPPPRPSAVERAASGLGSGNYVPKPFSPEQRVAFGADPKKEPSPSAAGVAEAKAAAEAKFAVTLKRRAIVDPAVAEAVAADEAGTGLRLVHRQALEDVELNVKTQRVATLRAQYDEIACRSEALQQQLEILSQAFRALSKVPASPDPRKAKPPGSARSRSPTTSDSGGSAIDFGASSLQRLSEELGGAHPQVLLEAAKFGVERRLSELEPHVAEADEYGETLEMMLFRLKESHARLVAHIATLRDHGLNLEKETSALQQLQFDAKGAATLAQNAKLATAAVMAQNAAMYATRLRAREAEVAEGHRKAAEWTNRQKQRAVKQAAMKSSIL